jgi:hypothetical protein
MQAASKRESASVDAVDPLPASSRPVHRTSPLEMSDALSRVHGRFPSNNLADGGAHSAPTFPGDREKPGSRVESDADDGVQARSPASHVGSEYPASSAAEAWGVGGGASGRSPLPVSARQVRCDAALHSSDEKSCSLLAACDAAVSIAVSALRDDPGRATPKFGVFSRHLVVCRGGDEAARAWTRSARLRVVAGCDDLFWRSLRTAGHCEAKYRVPFRAAGLERQALQCSEGVCGVCAGGGGVRWGVGCSGSGCGRGGVSGGVSGRCQWRWQRRWQW